LFSDTVSSLEQLQRRLGKAIENTIGIRAGIQLVEPHSIERSEGKARRVLDQREL